MAISCGAELLVASETQQARYVHCMCYSESMQLFFFYLFNSLMIVELVQLRVACLDWALISRL